MRKKVERVAAQLGDNPTRPVDEHPLVREKQAERERAAARPGAHHRSARRSSGTAVNVRLQKGEQIKAATVLFALVAALAALGGGELQGDRAHPRAGRA